MNNVMMPKIAGIGGRDDRPALSQQTRQRAFSSHGWSGGAVDRQSRTRRMPNEMSLSLKAEMASDLDALELCRQRGRDISASVGACSAAGSHTRKPRQQSKKPQPARRRPRPQMRNAAYASGFTTLRWASRCRMSRRVRRV